MSQRETAVARISIIHHDTDRTVPSTQGPFVRVAGRYLTVTIPGVEKPAEFHIQDSISDSDEKIVQNLIVRLLPPNSIPWKVKQ